MIADQSNSVTITIREKKGYRWTGLVLYVNEQRESTVLYGTFTFGHVDLQDSLDLQEPLVVNIPSTLTIGMHEVEIVDL